MASKSILQGKTASFSLKKTAGSLGHYDSSSPTQTRGEKDYIRFNFICNAELAQKVRNVSTKEGVTIRQIMEKAMTDWLTKYERKNGPVGNVKVRSVEDL